MFNSNHHQFFMIHNIYYLSLCSLNLWFLRKDDVILILNDQLITWASEFDIVYAQETVNALIVHNNKKMKIQINTLSIADLETNQALIFCDALLQKLHHVIQQQISKLHNKMYIIVKVCIHLFCFCCSLFFLLYLVKLINIDSFFIFRFLIHLLISMIFSPGISSLLLMKWRCLILASS